MHGRKNKENCALNLVNEIILYYEARSKKHQITAAIICLLVGVRCPYNEIKLAAGVSE